MSPYYADKLESLRDIFGTADVSLEPDRLRVRGRPFPILDDVILLSDPSDYPASVRGRLGLPAGGAAAANDVQSSFGQEWRQYGTFLEEHRQEFSQYFDRVDLEGLRGARVCDPGCGSGRWSYSLRDRCRELVLVDSSEAIFVARRNLAGTNGLFFMGDLLRLPFRDTFADLVVCLGVLHPLPIPCLEATRALGRLAPRLLVFLYYALDNRAWYFRLLLRAATFLRLRISRLRSPAVRKRIAQAGTHLLYRPLIGLGRALKPPGLASRVPLYDFYHDKTLRRVEQDVYDRFFTRIEQRVSRRDIMDLRDRFSRVEVSERLPYWHFLCER